ncbi:MAG: phosphotransferase [Verrucomicrobiota bacterium]
MSSSVPHRVEDITNEWLTAILRDSGAVQSSQVVSNTTKILGQDIGFLSVVAKVSLEYDQAEEGAPASIVIKFETLHPERRGIAIEQQAFEREIRFYREVAPEVEARLPKMYYTCCEPPHFLLVMEDLSYCTPGDQVVGMPMELVATSVRQMAQVHAAFWDNDRLNALDWMPETNNIEANFDENWDSFEEHFGKFTTEEGLALGRSMKPHVEWIFNEIAHRPKTITHNDLREDNLLFGEPGSPDEVIILDWQLATRSMGVFDVSRLMAGSALPDQRRGHEIEILRVWHNTLVENGVEDYYWEEALYDLRLALLQGLTYPIHFHRAFIGETGRSAELSEAIVRRHFASAIDLQADVALPK